MNNKLTGYFKEDESSPYSFIFTLPKNIRKFEIMIQGQYINYTINDIGKIKCNDKLNQTFTGQIQPIFLIFDIKSEIDTTNYNIQIQVDLNPIQYTTYETYYAIKVVPYDKLDHYPVYEIKGKTQLECYTGENGNTIYSFFYNKGIIPSNKFLIYALIAEQSDKKLRLT